MKDIVNKDIVILFNFILFGFFYGLINFLRDFFKGIMIM